MNRNSPLNFLHQPGCLIWLLAAACWVSHPPRCLAGPTIVSTVPANMGTAASPTTPFMVTFSEPMDPTATSVDFIDMSTFADLPTIPSWSANNTVLSCAPSSPWPINQMIVWTVDGQDPASDRLAGDNTGGVFTVSAMNTGCDTNTTLLSLTVAKGALYAQTSSGMPVLNSNTPYMFLSCLSLPCPRDATNISLTIPSGAVQGMALTPIPGHLTFEDLYATPAAVDAAYTAGDYVFNIQEVASNQQVTLDFPSTLEQPPAPHLSNFSTAQAVNPLQPFKLEWDPVAGGTPADCIYVEIYGGVFATPAPGEAGALDGTATGVTIPAGVLQPNRSYNGIVCFYHFLLATNDHACVSLLYRSTGTEFNLHTTGGSTSPLVLTNISWTKGGGFIFEVSCSIGQSLIAEYCTNLASKQWQTLCSLIGTSQSMCLTDPDAGTNLQVFYRVRTGP